MEHCTVSNEYERRGLETIFLENQFLKVEILAGKGGDVTELRDKRTDVDVLFDVPYEWHPPDDPYQGSPNATFSFMDHYPGGWQNIAPNAGGGSDIQGASFGLHGESALSPWDVEIELDTREKVQVTLSVSLTRYPLDMKRKFILTQDERKLEVNDLVENVGEVEVPYMWLQHLVFGPPLLDPEATIKIPCETVIADPFHDDPNSRFEPGEEIDWPTAASEDESKIDLATPPPKESRVHDLLGLTKLQEGWYEITNPSIDLGVKVTFPTDVFEYIWYWGAFGGFETSPFFGRNYNLGLEPCTSFPNAGLEEAVDRGTANLLQPGETEKSSITISTHAVGD